MREDDGELCSVLVAVVTLMIVLLIIGALMGL